MAIPKFYSILTRRYPQIHSIISSRQCCDHLLIDVNSLLHNCLERSQNQDEIVSLVKEFINQLVFLFQPSKSVYLAVDGVPPLAKIKEQALRRMNSKKNNNGIDSNILTPGTEYMKTLNDGLLEFQEELRIRYTDLKFEVSGSDEEGEGEQKIMKYMKSFTQESFIIYSSDADLIVMCLNSNYNEVRLVREVFKMRYNETKRKKFEMMNINILKTKLTSLITGMKKEVISNDLMLLLMLLGNDYLPTPELFSVSDSNIQLILQSLKDYYQKNENQSIIDPTSNVIIFSNLFKLFELIHEKQLNDYRSEYPLSQKILQQKSLELNLPLNLSLSEKKPKIKNYIKEFESARFREWRTIHYRKNHPELLEHLNEIGSEYLHRLQWLYDYYIQVSKPDVNSFWTFDHDFTPFISDLINMNPFKHQEKDKKVLKVYPLVQLCLVTPVKSIDLLPLALQKDPKIRQYTENHEQLTFERISEMVEHIEEINNDNESLIKSMNELKV